MKRDPLFSTLLESANTNFSGWDFSFISETGRMKSEPLSWSYGSTAFQLMQHAESMLDMGTGGGEFLSMLQPFPSTIYATEGYAPNVPIARKKLEPLGVTVVEVINDTVLPFQDGQFDFIINQHESYAASEVKRILSPNGVFIVYYLKAIPWQIPDFTVERYYEELYRIHEIILQKGYFDVKQHRFIIKAIHS
ncbi:Methyltransferase domain protein [Bacillus paranthracis]|uniref:class I SAM-dependent methyltransferase n=1 Tax=Bacillus paranthracis TaxID=2026186 RepID=UPI000A3011B5|nr:class I SAM-dependent methyltransferase [Bacillus paranthracis]MCR6792885.1 class I SAM-dependent methyltransferase [Bacillus paranthracis]MED1166080.1 class I SAM-dependent methyltransferase [Bacillus paranthracis]SME39130.1 Methyltransferase domain protein [Bacillus paranthracis]